MFQLPNEPQTIGKTLDVGFKLYFSGMRYILLFSFLLSVIFLIPTFVLGRQPSNPGDTLAWVGKFYLWFFGVSIIGIVFMVAAIYRLHSFTTGNLASIGESLWLGLKLLVPVFIASLLYGLMVMFGFIFLIIPGVALAVYFILCTFAITTERCGPIAGLERSLQLVKGNWWRSFIIMVVGYIVYVVLYSLVLGIYTLSIYLSASLESFEEYYIYLELGGALIGTLYYPLFTAIMLSLFNDLRLRRDGGDIEARIAEMS